MLKCNINTIFWNFFAHSDSVVYVNQFMIESYENDYIITNL